MSALTLDAVLEPLADVYGEPEPPPVDKGTQTFPQLDGEEIHLDCTTLQRLEGDIGTKTDAWKKLLNEREHVVVFCETGDEELDLVDIATIERFQLGLERGIAGDPRSDHDEPRSNRTPDNEPAASHQRLPCRTSSRIERASAAPDQR